MGTTIGIIKGDTRSLDNGSCKLICMTPWDNQMRGCQNYGPQT